MIIVKFAMVAFLTGLTLMLALRPGQGVPMGGPYFYLQKPGSLNPIRPDARLNAFQATKARRVWRVWFDGRGQPVRWRLFDGKVEVYAEELHWDRVGRLRARRRIPTN